MKRSPGSIFILNQHIVLLSGYACHSDPSGKSLPHSDAFSARVHPPSQKYFAFSVGQINFRSPAVSRPTEGRIAIVMARWARDAMDAAASGSIVVEPDENAAAYGKVVWS